MKNIIILLVGILLFPACDDFLEKEPLGAPSTAGFWKSQADVDAALNAIINVMYDGATNVRNVYYGRPAMWPIAAGDDMIVGKSKSSGQRIHNFQIAGPEKDIDILWIRNYLIIKRATDVIINVPTVSGLSESAIDKALGIAYFYRGMAHFYVAYRYGNEKMGVPIKDENNTLDFFVDRASHVIDNYAFIEEDLLLAADLLPSLSETEEGAPHKLAALAFLTKTYMYWAEYDNTKWADVVTTANQIIGQEGRVLESNYVNVFKIVNNYGSEYLWSATGSINGSGCPIPGQMLENGGYQSGVAGWGYFHPTQELYDAFEVGDTRLKVTIQEYGDAFTYLGTPMIYASTSSETGMQFNKYMDPWTGYPDNSQLHPNGDKNPSTALNVPIIRLADVVLMKAEALLSQGQNADVEINMIRARAGLSLIAGATMAQLKNERRCELAGELNDRHFDLVRWNDAEAVYHQDLHGREHNPKGDPTAPYTLIAPPRTGAARTNFNPNVHDVWPIPFNEVAISRGTLVQNEGW